MNNEQKVRNIPTIFIIFGATGDLMAKKITPALFSLFLKNKLPNLFKIIGFSRRDFSDSDFKTHVAHILRNHDRAKYKKDDIERFLNYFIYKRGDFAESDSYKSLATFLGRTDDEWRVCSNKLFYLAVPPQFYEQIFVHLKSSGLTIPCGPDEGWTRVIVEKPFGRNAKTAQKLDEMLGDLFREEQIFRIDHYLAKEMLQNIISFRFSNDIFRDLWDNKNIESIEIRFLEKVGVEGREVFYEGVGALRDYGQSHALQTLALITMDQPKDFAAPEVRKKRSEILRSLIPLEKEEVSKKTARGQYIGYTDQEGVASNSVTETYFKVIGYLSAPRWAGVPITLESGKKIEDRKEVVITFKHRTPCLCPQGAHYKNRLTFSLDPKEGIIIEFWSKKPGLEFQMEKQKLSFLFRDERKKVQYIEEYEKLLTDCISGNQLLFVSTDEVHATWKFIDSIIDGWEKGFPDLVKYKPYNKKILKNL